ncbi:hypothetical protein ACQR1V_32110, partial [Bradyrhizobium oligotrophicum]
EESTPCTMSSLSEPDSRGLDPAIHVARHPRTDVDARVKPGHDGETNQPRSLWARGALFNHGPRAGSASAINTQPASIDPESGLVKLHIRL